METGTPIEKNCKSDEITHSDPRQSLSEYLSAKLEIEWTDILTLFNRSILEKLCIATNRKQYFRLLLEEVLLRYLYILVENPTEIAVSPSFQCG